MSQTTISTNQTNGVTLSGAFTTIARGVDISNPMAANGTNASIHLLADGRIIMPFAGPNGALGFDLPHPVRDLVLVSRRTTGTGSDRRGLGIAIAAIAIDDRPIDLATLSDRGWHDLEGDGCRHWRWTDGAGQLFSTRHPCRLTIEIAGTLRYRRLALAA